MANVAKRRLIVVALRAILVYVWLRSSLSHLANPYFFLGSVYQYDLIDLLWAPVLAEFLPIWELVLAGSILTGFFYRAGLMGSAATLALFLAVQGITLWRGLDISCGCFGPSSSSKIGWDTLGLVTLLLVVSIAGVENSAADKDSQLTSNNRKKEG